MDIRALRLFIEECERWGVCPTWDRLLLFEDTLRKAYRRGARIYD